jgi:hypothetical protein
MAQNQTTDQKGVPLAPLDSLVECCRLVDRVSLMIDRSTHRVAVLRLPLLFEFPYYILRRQVQVYLSSGKPVVP